MSNFIKRLLFNTAINEGSRSPLIQRAAEQVVRMERSVSTTGMERAGLWLGATAREISSDINSIMGSSKSSGSNGGESHTGAQKAPGRGSGGSKTPPSGCS